MIKPAERKGKFIEQFGGPGEGSAIVCFKFWQLKHALGCPFTCAYCFLQTTQIFLHQPELLMGRVYSNMSKMQKELAAWLADPTPKMLEVGELQDGLAFEEAHRKANGSPLTHMVVPPFAKQNRHRIIFLTKSTAINYALELEPTQQAVFSWSVNAEEVARRWEKGAPLPSARLAAAEKMKAAGWPIRLRLDPMVPYRGWRDGYAALIDRINALGPEMVTLGALRAHSGSALRTRAGNNGRDTTIFDFLSEEKDPSGFKYRLPEDQQLELFKFAIDRLEPRITPALCKEDRSIWQKLGMNFGGCHCLLGSGDALLTPSSPAHLLRRR